MSLVERGSKKWVSLMLPEHLAMIKEWKKEQNFIKRPKLDEWQLEDFQLTISQALNENKPVQITTWANGEIVITEGVIQEVDKYQNECLLNCQLDVIKRIQLSSICDIGLLEEL